MSEVVRTFVKVKTQPIPYSTEPSYGLERNGKKRIVGDLAKLTGFTPCEDSDLFGLFRWHDPLANAINGISFPQRLRSFRPCGEMSSDEREASLLAVQKHGPFVPYPISSYKDQLLNSVEATRLRVVERTVPPHQGRGFRDHGIFYFETPRGPQIKLTVCTKGSGTTGYWEGRRKDEMEAAILNGQGDYPLHPDAFHARDHTGQSVGQKKGDEIVWVGCASDTVTQREVEGFETYAQLGIFSPLCLPVRNFEELPLATGEIIPTTEFTGQFSKDTKLVYLAKAWALETRVWGNHFSHSKLTAAHILSAKEDGRFIYEKILDDLKLTASERAKKLAKDEVIVRSLMENIDPESWKLFLGHAGEILSKDSRFVANLKSIGNVIPAIMSINMIENVAKAGAARMWGKPVAWHTENIGRLGEVSGGERIYGCAKGSIPDAQELHSFFSYLFDSYFAVAMEFSANGIVYVPIEKYYETVKNRLLKLNPEHWINNYSTLEQLVIICQGQMPVYKVNFRSEDTYPLVAVLEATSPSCILVNERGQWKDWRVLRSNLGKFINSARKCYLETQLSV